MAWIDDRIWCHPKLTDLSDGAWRVFVSGIAYSSGMGTKGMLTSSQQKLVGARDRTRVELIAAGLWDAEDDGSVFIHDWDEHNGKRDERKRKDRDRKREARSLERMSAGQVADKPPDKASDRRALTSDRVTVREPNGSLGPPTRPRNPIWDALVEVFGEPSTKTAQTLRGKVSASLTQAGATHDEVIRRAKSWPRHFENATLTETALEKHWDALGRPPLRMEGR